MSRLKDACGEFKRESKREGEEVRTERRPVFRLSADLDVIDARVLPFFAAGFYADLRPVGDEDAGEGPGLPCVVIYVRRPRADHGAADAKGEGHLTVVFVVIPDYDVARSGGAGVSCPDVADRVRERAGAIFALEVIGLVIGLRHALGFEPDRAAAAAAGRARALAGAGFRNAPVGEQDGLVAQLRDAVQA